MRDGGLSFTANIFCPDTRPLMRPVSTRTASVRPAACKSDGCACAKNRRAAQILYHEFYRYAIRARILPIYFSIKYTKKLKNAFFQSARGLKRGARQNRSGSFMQTLSFKAPPFRIRRCGTARAKRASKNRLSKSYPSFCFTARAAASDFFTQLRSCD